MEYKDVLEFVSAHPVCTLATCDSHQPHARGFLTNIINDTIYFTTSAKKKVGAEILRNRQSELCYLSGDFSKMLRITTTLQILDDTIIKQKLIDMHDYLKGYSVDDEEFVLLGLSASKARFWTLMDNLHEDRLEVIEF